LADIAAPARVPVIHQKAGQGAKKKIDWDFGHRVYKGTTESRARPYRQKNRAMKCLYVIAAATNLIDIALEVERNRPWRRVFSNPQAFIPMWISNDGLIYQTMGFR